MVVDDRGYRSAVFCDSVRKDLVGMRRLLKDDCRGEMVSRDSLDAEGGLFSFGYEVGVIRKCEVRVVDVFVSKDYDSKREVVVKCRSLKVAELLDERYGKEGYTFSVKNLKGDRRNMLVDNDWIFWVIGLFISTSLFLLNWCVFNGSVKESIFAPAILMFLIVIIAMDYSSSEIKKGHCSMGFN